VLDSGVRATHHDLAGFLEPGVDLVDGDNDPEDTLGHGTQVASRIVQGFHAAGGQEHAELRILPIKVLQDDGRFLWSDVADGLRACQGAGADFVSLSFGHTSGAPEAEAAIRELADAGITVLAAAGNSGRCDDCVSFPAHYESVVAVGCIDDDAVACPKSSAGSQLDLVAPGMRVEAASISSDTAHVRATGTSLAAPFAAGMLAAMSAAGIAPTAALQDAADLGPQGWDPLYGAGQLVA
jgi:subtilisin family serine protease